MKNLFPCNVVFYQYSLINCCKLREMCRLHVCDRSYGVVLWEIVSLATVPYCGLANEQIVQNVKNGVRNKLDPVPECPSLL